MPRSKVLVVLLEYINLIQSEWQHETDIWEELPCPLPVCSNLLLFCQHFALCFYLPIIPIFLPAKSTHP